MNADNKEPTSKLAIQETAMESIAIDAALEDWEQYNYLHGLMDPWKLKAKDDTHFDFTTTPKYFYFYFKAKDTTPTKIIDYVNERSLLYQDRVELFFSSTKELDEYYGAEITPQGKVLDFKAHFPRDIDHSWNFQTLDFASKNTDDGYIVEGRISRKELLSFGIVNSLYMGIFRADFHGGRKVNWHTRTLPDSPKADFHIPSAFEKTVFRQ
nr:sugar-binding protein [Allomuricauda sp.]